MSQKVGIVTFHNHQNFGAVFQAYGLSHALEQLGAEPYFICDKRKEDNASKTNEEAAEKIPDKRFRRVFGAVANLAQVHKKKFLDFVQRNLKETDLTKEKDLNQEFDLFIAGSDQVWNYEITGVDSFWFLDFAKKEKRFSYAASFGMDALPEKGKMWYQKQLQGFSGISVREESGQRIVEELLGDCPALCPDPVFLPETSVWESVKKECEESVVLYMLEFDAELYQAAKKHAEELKVPFVYMGFANVTTMSYKPVLCSPEEWLGYIYHAKAVYTNSFHGTVFSVLFHKKMYFKSLVHLARRNGRISSLFERLNVTKEERKDAQGIFEIKFENGWEASDAKIAELRKEGMDYLQGLL